MAAPLLLLTHDDGLTAAVGRLAAAAGVDLVVEDEPGRARSTWASASAVLVGADVAATAASSPPPRRDLVHVLSPGPAADPLFRQAVSLGAASVVELPEGESWLAGVLADLGDEVLGAGVVVAVVGGCGGVGASTFAAALAATACSRDSAAAVALVDLDPLGPGLPGLLGRDGGSSGGPGGAGAGRGAVTWSGLAASRGRLGARELRTALAPRDGLGVLGWPGPGELRDLPDPGVLREVVSAAARGHEVVVLDVPRHASADLAPVLTCDHWLVLVRPGVGPVAAAREVVDRLRGQGADVRALVAGDLGADAVGRILGVPVLASVGRHRRLDEHLELGLGPVHGRRNPLASAAREVLDALGTKVGRR